MAGWNNLPLELRLIIVGYIRTFLIPWPGYTPPYPLLSLVSREWYGYFSHEVFRLIVLNQDRLDDFARLVGTNKPRQTYVNRIILRIRLPEYGCAVCQTPEGSTTARLNDVIFIKTVQRLLGIMSTWEKSRSGIQLDLGVYSPSDCRHGFRDCRLSPGYPYGANSEVHEQYAAALSLVSASEGYRICPGWRRRYHGDPPLVGSTRRLLSIIGDPQSPHFEAVFGSIDFACAPAITFLAIRRQYYRHISPEILTRLINRMPQLTTLRDETWFHPDQAVHTRFLQGYAAAIDALPDTITILHLFCESNTTLPPHEQTNTAAQHAAGARLGLSLARVASKLTEFSASFFIEAGYFLRPSISGLISYPNLGYLILTSRLLSRAHTQRGSTTAVDLLFAAATMAFVHMPSARFLDLWYAKDGYVLIIRFFRDRPRAGSEKPEKLSVFCWSTWHRYRDLSALLDALRARWDAAHPHRALRTGGAMSFDDTGAETWHPLNYAEHYRHVIHYESRRQIQIESRSRTRSSICWEGDWPLHKVKHAEAVE